MKTIIYLFFVILSCSGLSQTPYIQWQKCYGGSNWDINYTVINTKDHGLMIIGSTISDDGDFIGNTWGLKGLWIVKTDSASNLIWQKAYGGSYGDDGYCARETPDGGYIIIGSTESNDSGIVGHSGGSFANEDFWVIKIDSVGTMQWNHCYGGGFDERPYDIRITPDHGYIIAGETNSAGHGDYDAWLVKIDSVGNVVHQRTFGGSDYDVAENVYLLPSGGYLFSGSTNSDDGDVSGNHGAFSGDGWLVKIDTAFNIVWQKCYGGSGLEGIAGVEMNSDATRFTIIANSNSVDGDLSGCNNVYSSYWLFTIDSSRTILWQNCIGGPGPDNPYAMSGTIDGGFIIAGEALEPSSPTFCNNSFQLHYWVVKADSNGNMQWAKCLGGSGADRARSVVQTPDEGYVVAGHTLSNDLDVSGNHGDEDWWVVKLMVTPQSVNETPPAITELTTHYYQENGLISTEFFSRSNSKTILRILDTTGRSIFIEEFSIHEGINHHDSYVGNISNGIYIIQMENKDGFANYKMVAQ